MNYRTFGKTPLQVSEIGLGCEHLEGRDTQTVVQVVNAALDAGINILDCFMPEPKVRSDLGEALCGQRDRMLIQGHFRTIWKDGQYTRTLDIDEVKRSFDDLLSRLKTDHIEFGMLHMIDNEHDFHAVFDGPILAYAQELKQQGVIKCIGVSTHHSGIALEMAQSGVLVCMMLSVNPAYDLVPPSRMKIQLAPEDLQQSAQGLDPIRASLYRVCQQQGIAITTMKTFAAGLLLHDKLSPFGKALTDYQCIRYALDRPSVTTAMLGMKTVEEVARAAAYAEASPEETDYTSLLRLSPKYSQVGACVYCNHCLPCPAGLNIAQIHKYVDLACVGDTVPPTIRAHYAALSVTASACIGCGSCEKACPFGVQVRERMQQAVSIFGK